MNKNIIIVLAGGLIIAVLVAVLVQATLSGKKQPPVKEEPKSLIVVAAKPLKAGDMLSDENMRWQSWPQGAIFPGAIVQKESKKPAEMITGRLLRDVADGEPIVQTALVKEEKGNFLAASLGPGMRALAINVKPATMVGGFVSPGDRVDVILTYKSKVSISANDAALETQIKNLIAQNISTYATETVLQNVRVMAIDQEAKKSDDKVKVGKTVTVEVSPRDAEKLALAEQMGDLSLSLRSLGDDKITVSEEPVVTDQRMTGIFQELYDQVYQQGASQKSNIVRIYTGGLVQQMPVSE